MNDQPATGCPYSLRDLDSTYPYDLYEKMRAYSGEAGSAVWDEKMKAWLFVSSAACREMLLQDISKLKFWTHSLGAVAHEIHGNRALKMLFGTDQQRVHKWWVLQFSPAGLAPFRTTGIRPLVHRLIDEFIESGETELASAYARRLPVRAICVITGLPVEDDEWIEECQALMEPIDKFFNYAMSGSDEIMENARLAAHALDAKLLPFIEARRDGTGDDLISRLWRDGPALMPEWGIPDMLSHVRNMLFAGAETTRNALASTFYIMCTEPEVMAQVRTGGDEAIDRFVEESLRLYGPVHYRSRRAIDEMEIAGCPVAQDGPAIAVLAAANRDPARYADPDKVRLDRPNPRDHLTFNYGPRACAGAGLARMELTESVRAFIERLPDMHLDPAKPKPEYGGLALRDWKPVHVRFTPGAKRN